MRQKFFFPAMLQHTALAAISQSVSKSITFKDELRPALQLAVTNESRTADQTILAKLKETGYKPGKTGSFMNKHEAFYIAAIHL
jgi:hypothetical protein